MSEVAPVRLFVFGLGYSARAIADRLPPDATVVGTARTPSRPGLLAFDGTAPGAGVAAALAEATHLLVSVPPGADDPVLRHHRADIVRAPRLGWIGYLSTVGVYGDHGGAWVDEATEPRPVSRRSVERVAAERAWAELAEARGVPLALLRLAGIYGPGRNAFVNLAAGKARRLVKPGQVFNRIHVDDIGAVGAGALTAAASGVFNVTDDAPSPPQDVVAHAAALMGVAPPPEVDFETADLSPMARSFYGENKRVANRRIRDALGLALVHPTYREGLAALWRTGSWRG